jgi:hypothetical protein
MILYRSRIVLGMFPGRLRYSLGWRHRRQAKHVSSPEITPAFVIAGAFASVSGVLAGYAEASASVLRDLARRSLILLRQYGPLSASIAFDVIWAAWHFEIFFHSVSADAPLFTAVALSILTTVWFLHT